MFFLLILHKTKSTCLQCHSTEPGSGKMAIKSGPKNTKEMGFSGRGKLRTGNDRISSGSRS